MEGKTTLRKECMRGREGKGKGERMKREKGNEGISLGRLREGISPERLAKWSKIMKGVENNRNLKLKWPTGKVKKLSKIT